MIDRAPNRTALREARRLQRLGRSPSICAFCSYQGPVIAMTLKGLKALGVSKKFLEDHHPSGENHDPGLKIPICRNCHWECTEGLLRTCVRMRPVQHKNESIALTLEAQATFFENFATAQRRTAERVRSLRQ